MSAGKRKYDLVIWGATGFTGSLVCEYMSRRLPTQDVKWAIAGRSKAKLDSLKRKLSLEGVDVLVGDAADQKFVDEIVLQTKTILTTVGPFAQHGEPLIASCAKHGTDYIDSTGESLWVRRMIDKYDAVAKQSGAILVPMCGFDSIPSDLGTLLIVDHMERKLGQKCRSVRAVFSMNACSLSATFPIFGSASGGTIASGLNLQTFPKAELREASKPFFLNPGRQRPAAGADGKARKEDADQYFVSYDKDLKTWTAPFIMAMANTRVVRRSAALAELTGHSYGSEFSYNEAAKASGPIVAFIRVLVLALALLLISIPFTRSLALRVLPKPGEGPSPTTRAKAWFITDLVGHTEDGKIVRAQVKGRDPGYDETAKMLAESALTLVLHRGDLPASRTGGILTPATALGMTLMRRLNAAGITFKIIEDESV